MATSPPCSCSTPQQWSSAALHSLPSYGAAWHSTGLPRSPAPECSRVVFSSAQAATYSLVRCNKALSSFLPLCVLMLCEIEHLFSFKYGIPTSQLNFLLQPRLWEPQLLHPSSLVAVGWLQAQRWHPGPGQNCPELWWVLSCCAGAD